MPLILAIEPDKRQSAQLASLVKGLHAELVCRTNATDALDALQGRVPDLVLTTSLISPKDDAALGAHLRELGVAAAHVQTVTIPLLGSAAPARAKGGMLLAALRREKPQAPMTEGCAPEVFAEQVRQYLVTADEQKAVAVTRLALEPAADAFADSFEAEPVLEATPPELESELVVEFSHAEPEPAVETYEPPAPIEPEPVEAEAFVELAPAVTALEPEPVTAAAFLAPEEPARDEPETFVADEPEEFAAGESAGLPLSQLLHLVSATAVEHAPIVERRFVDEAPIAELEPAIEASAPVDLAEWQDELEAAPVVRPKFSPEPELVAEPELAVEPALAMADDFGELYVDPVAAQALDELSRQAAPPSLGDGIPTETPVPVVEMHAFQSLDSIVSELAAGPSPRRHESLDDLASLFAATPAPATLAPRAPAPAEPVAHEFIAPQHGENSLFASLFAEPAPRPGATPIDVPGIDPSLFASVPAASSNVFDAPPVPVHLESFVETSSVESLILDATLPEPAPVYVEPVVVQAAVEELEPIAESAAEEPDINFEAVAFAPAYEEPVAAAAAPGFDEEISLDVDAFVAAPTVPEPAPEPARFSFTFVDGFGDAWSDFEVPTISAIATDLGVGEHAPLDPNARSARIEKPAPAPRETAAAPSVAPTLDDEALSLIGDAARRVGLDAFVVEEFERGVSAAKRARKPKKNVHAGATQVTPAPERPAAKPAKRPVQDEWGMFDPEQCGFAALDDEEGEESRPTTGTRVRVISY